MGLCVDPSARRGDRSGRAKEKDRGRGGGPGRHRTFRESCLNINLGSTRWVCENKNPLTEDRLGLKRVCFHPSATDGVSQHPYFQLLHCILSTDRVPSTTRFAPRERETNRGSRVRIGTSARGFRRGPAAPDPPSSGPDRY